MTPNIPRAWADVTDACETHQSNCAGDNGSTEALATLLALRCTLEDQAAWSYQLLDSALEYLHDAQVNDDTASERLDNLVKAIRIHLDRIHLERYSCPERGCPAIEWGRDCDNVEATTLRWINPPTVGELGKVQQSIEENAEGPWTLRLITLQAAEEFEPSSRDRNLEAFENGRGTSATI